MILITFKERTEKFGAAIRALRELERSEPGKGERACGEFLSEQNDDILEDAGTRKLESYPCVRRILGKKHLGTEHDCLLPGSDHTELRKTREGKLFYVTQPYGIGWDDLRALVKKGEELGLKISIHADSTWFPGRTILIVAEGRPAPGKGGK